MKTVRSNSAGFSLVELMVVVAIIGILATIAVPQVNKFMAKARQSEAKSNLSTLYSTQKAFKAEYNTYYSGFNQIGYAPEGDLRYRIGFAAAGAITPALLESNYGYPGVPGAQLFSTAAYCTSGPDACVEMLDATAAGAFATATLTNQNAFIAASRSGNIGFAVPDEWAMDQNKQLTNPVAGIQ